jgi:hypothetical protein
MVTAISSQRLNIQSPSKILDREKHLERTHGQEATVHIVSRTNLIQ